MIGDLWLVEDTLFFNKPVKKTFTYKDKYNSYNYMRIHSAKFIENLPNKPVEVFITLTKNKKALTIFKLMETTLNNYELFQNIKDIIPTVELLHSLSIRTNDLCTSLALFNGRKDLPRSSCNELCNITTYKRCVKKHKEFYFKKFVKVYLYYYDHNKEKVYL